MSDLDEYGAVVAKVNAFVDGTTERRRADLACAAGCDGCCHVSLEVSPVEAEALRRHLAAADAATRHRVAARAAQGTGDRCVMLDEDGLCAVYGARPLVCRTQGMALRYPPDVVPAEAVMGKRGDGELTWCPLNYTERGPDGPDVIDAEHLDALLALVNRRWAEARGEDPLRRVPLDRLAAEAGSDGKR